MSSEEDSKYHAKLEVTRADKKELLIKEVPAEWFNKPRNLVVNLDKGRTITSVKVFRLIAALSHQHYKPLL